jgi:CBS domain-containing protein/ribosome-associated translation inhibitor RaiA
LSVARLPKYVEALREQPIEPFISNLIHAPPNSTLSKVTGLLSERGTYDVFFPESNRCGVISARSVLRTAVETTKLPALISYVPALKKDASIGAAARLMSDYRIRAVPVSDGRKIIGEVKCVNLLQELNGRIGQDLKVASIATKNPLTVDAEAPTAKARDLMVRKRIDHIPVTRTGRLAGILTSTDVVVRMAQSERVGPRSIRPETRGTLDFPVGNAMDLTPLTCPPETSVDQALETILKSAKTYILVTQWEELQGIATYRDFMTLLAEPEQETEVPIFMVGLPDDPFEAEATKTKFKRTINQLHRIFPDILEARSVIKSRFTKPGKERGRYEVHVHIRTTTNSYSYSDEGWELPAVYDLITDRLKRLMTQKQSRRRDREREAPKTAE